MVIILCFEAGIILVNCNLRLAYRGHKMEDGAKQKMNLQ